LANYDETKGSYVHASADVEVPDIAVSVSTCTTWDGHEIEPPTVFVEGYDLSIEETVDLIDSGQPSRFSARWSGDGRRAYRRTMRTVDPPR
jgi:hypothetical protein